MTPSQSSAVMLTSMRSRRMPALATALPPAPMISSTTASAGPEEAPVPSTPPPTSLTTTRAPPAASAIACARPNPRPAPVTAATRPSHRSVIGNSWEQLSCPVDRDLREHAVGLGGDRVARKHRSPGVDAPAFPGHVPGVDPQPRIQRRGTEIADLQLDGHP